MSQSSGCVAALENITKLATSQNQKPRCPLPPNYNVMGARSITRALEGVGSGHPRLFWALKWLRAKRVPFGPKKVLYGSCEHLFIFLSNFYSYLCPLKLVLRIRIRIRIHVFLGLPDPDPLVSAMDPDPDPLSSCKNSKKNLDSYYFVTLFDFEK